MIDGLLLQVVLAVVLAVVVWIPAALLKGPRIQPQERTVLLIQQFLWGMAINWLYAAFAESSRWQGTVGKRALGFMVTTMGGERLTFGRANARYWSKVLSSLPLGLGFAMAAFHPRKQAFHDRIARTLVVRIAGVRAAAVSQSGGANVSTTTASARMSPILIVTVTMVAVMVTALVAGGVWQSRSARDTSQRWVPVSGGFSTTDGSEMSGLAHPWEQALPTMLDSGTELFDVYSSDRSTMYRLRLVALRADEIMQPAVLARLERTVRALACSPDSPNVASSREELRGYEYSDRFGHSVTSFSVAVPNCSIRRWDTVPDGR